MSFWGHNETHFSFGIGNMLPDLPPPSQNVPKFEFGNERDPPTPLFGTCSQILHIFFGNVP